MKRMIPWHACAAWLVFAMGSGQTPDATPEEALRLLPMPALDAADAAARCPRDVDTLVQPILRELSLRAERDSLVETAGNRHARLQADLLGKPQTELEQRVFAAGEQLDKELRDCPKVVNEKAERVYDPTCVEAAEERARRSRIAAVDHYLSTIHRIWPTYVDSTRRIVSQTREGKWGIVLRVATDVARITETAAEFGR